MKICDLHTHLLPGVDDGAQDISQALQMLDNAVASDVTHLVVTPHFIPSRASVQALADRFEHCFQRLQQAAAHLPIELALGAEVRVTPDLLDCLQTAHLPTLNGSRYLLTEFPVDFEESRFPMVLEKLLENGYVPLIDHPERYNAVCGQPGMVEQWLDMGCHLQLTGGSIQGNYGKTIQHAAAFLLQQDFVACVASDAHGVHRRTNYLLDVYDYLTVHFSPEYAHCMMYTNPLRMWRNESL
jgi:protein-tyrosine phosphatase